MVATRRRASNAEGPSSAKKKRLTDAADGGQHSPAALEAAKRMDQVITTAMGTASNSLLQQLALTSGQNQGVCQAHVALCSPGQYRACVHLTDAPVHAARPPFPASAGSLTDTVTAVLGWMLSVRLARQLTAEEQQAVAEQAKDCADKLQVTLDHELAAAIAADQPVDEVVPLEALLAALGEQPEVWSGWQEEAGTGTPGAQGQAAAAGSANADTVDTGLQMLATTVHWAEPEMGDPLSELTEPVRAAQEAFDTLVSTFGRKLGQAQALQERLTLLEQQLQQKDEALAQRAAAMQQMQVQLQLKTTECEQQAAAMQQLKEAQRHQPPQPKEQQPKKQPDTVQPDLSEEVKKLQAELKQKETDMAWQAGELKRTQQQLNIKTKQLEKKTTSDTAEVQKLQSKINDLQILVKIKTEENEKLQPLAQQARALLDKVGQLEQCLRHTTKICEQQSVKVSESTVLKVRIQQLEALLSHKTNDYHATVRQLAAKTQEADELRAKVGMFAGVGGQVMNLLLLQSKQAAQSGAISQPAAPALAPSLPQPAAGQTEPRRTSSPQQEQQPPNTQLQPQPAAGQQVKPLSSQPPAQQAQPAASQQPTVNA